MASVQSCPLKEVKGPISVDWDGKFLPDCPCSYYKNSCGAKSGSSIQPSAGKKPDRCLKENLEKVYYINGINTRPEENCATTKLLSQTLCKEVIGVYNRTEGGLIDFSESIGNIYGKHPKGGDKPVKTIKQILKDSKGESVTIYAHSQGGLITREALFDFRNELAIEDKMSSEELQTTMSKIDIKSFGTATDYWPSGPSYEQFTNKASIADIGGDPVPMAISFADTPKMLLKGFDFFKSAPKYATIPEENKHNFMNDKILILDGTDPHNMNKTYIPKLHEIESQRKKNKCSNCTN